MTLDELNINEAGIVISVGKNSDLYQRFLDIGIIENTKIKCVLISPYKDPKAFWIRGTVIAIRNEDAKFIKILKEGDISNG